MEAALSHAALSYLWDHRVAGRALFPAAAMLEAAAAAALAMLSASAGALSAQAALTGASIPAPLVLPSAAQQASAAVSLLVTLLARSGSIEVASASRSRQGHLKAAAACMLSASAAPSASCSQQALSAAIAAALNKVQETHTTTAVAVASVLQSQHQPVGQYLIHPAVIDCCTQAGAAHASPEDALAVTRVPAGLHACAIRGRLASPEAYATAVVVGLLADGTAVSDYGLCSKAAESTSSMAISAMLFKPVSRAKGEVAPSAAEPRGVFVQDALYELSWAVAAPEAAPAGLPAQRRPLMTWQATLSGGARTATARFAAGSSGLALAGSLRFIQAQAAKAAIVRLHTPAAPLDALLSCAGVSTMWGRAALCDAGANGLLRVAAQEFPGTSWQHFAGSGEATASAVQLRPADAFGLTSSRSLSLTPRLQRSHAASTAGPAALEGMLGQAGHNLGGSVIVTGGLGDIGSLSGTWAAECLHGAHVYLVGRTGRAGTVLPQALLCSGAAVHVVRCDTTQSCEVDALVHAVRCVSPPLRAVMHAGGVLQDALLPKQVRA